MGITIDQAAELLTNGELTMWEAVFQVCGRKPGGGSLYQRTRRAILDKIGGEEKAQEIVNQRISRAVAKSVPDLSTKGARTPALTRRPLDHSWMIVIYSYGRNGGCFGCGETELSTLSVHHLFGKAKQGGKSGKNLRHWLIRNNLPHGYMVLCENCHRRFHSSHSPK